MDALTRRNLSLENDLNAERENLRHAAATIAEKDSYYHHCATAPLRNCATALLRHRALRIAPCASRISHLSWRISHLAPSTLRIAHRT